MNMKKLILLTMMAALPFGMMAQDDDMYFVPTKENINKEKKTYGMPRNTYYSGSQRSVDDYNRTSRMIGRDSAVNEVIDFSAIRGVMNDSTYAEGDTDYQLTRQLTRFDDYHSTDAAYWEGYQDGRWSSPWYYSNSYYPWYSGWYEPWYYGSWYGWYGYYRPWVHYGYYNPWDWRYPRYYGGRPRPYRPANMRPTNHRPQNLGGRNYGGYRDNSRTSGGFNNSSNGSSFGGYRSSGSSSGGGSFGGGHSGGGSTGGGRSATGGRSFGGRR